MSASNIIGDGPLARLAREREALFRAMDTAADKLTDEAVDAEWDRVKAIDAEIVATEAATVPEMIAKLQVARDDFWQFNFEGRKEKTDPGNQLVLAAMDNALRLLRARD